MPESHVTEELSFWLWDSTGGRLWLAETMLRCVPRVWKGKEDSCRRLVGEVSLRFIS